MKSPPKLCDTAIEVGDRRTFYGPQRCDQEINASKRAEPKNIIMIKGKRTKRLIKIIRRKDVGEITAAANVPSNVNGTNQVLSAASDEKKKARLISRDLDSTVLRWIRERRENSRNERNAALKMLYGKALLAGR